MLLGSRPPHMHYGKQGPGSPYVGWYTSARYVAGHKRRARAAQARHRIADPDT